MHVIKLDDDLGSTIVVGGFPSYDEAVPRLRTVLERCAEEGLSVRGGIVETIGLRVSTDAIVDALRERRTAELARLEKLR